MNKRMTILLAPAFAVALAVAASPAVPSDKKDDIDQLIQQLGSDDFQVREEASRRLAPRDDALPKLRQAVKSEDAEVRRRAGLLVAAISQRLDEKALQELFADVNKGGIDRFIDRMATSQDYATPERWEIAYRLAKGAAERAGRLSGRSFKAPDLSLSAMPTQTECPEIGCDASKLRIDGLKHSATALDGCFVVSAGSLQHFTGVDNCVLFVNGDMEGITSTSRSFIFCNGNLGSITGVYHSVILCTGEFKGSTSADGSFFHVRKMGRHTAASDNVYINLKEVLGAPPTNGNLFLPTEEGPLQMFSLFDPKTMGVELTAADNGAKVAAVRDGTPFAKAGFQKGDLVVEVNNAPAASVEAIRKCLRRGRPAAKPGSRCGAATRSWN